MASIFTKIILGELPAHRVAETRDFLAFLDINPLRPGHTLVIPKQEVDNFFELDDETYIGLNLLAKTLAPAIQKATGASRIASAVIGLEVPHAHLHLIPMDTMEDMNWANRQPAEDKDLAAMAQKIRAAL